MSLLDSLLGGYVYAQQDGQPSAAPARKTLIFSGATVTDDGPTANSTTVTISGGGGSFPGGDLCSGTGTTVTVGSRLTLAGGTLSADAQLSGTSSQLAAGDGSAVTVGSGLTLAAGTLTASGGGGGGASVGTFASRPAASSGATYYPTDGWCGYVADGATWRPLIGGIAGSAPPAASTFTAYNMSATSTLVDNNGVLIASDDSMTAAVPDYRLWTQSLTGGSVGVEACVQMTPTLAGWNDTLASYCFGGIALRESATGKVTTLMLYATPAQSTKIDISAEYAASATTSRTVINSATNQLFSVIGPNVFLRIRPSGGTLYYEYSTGRGDWFRVSSIAVSTVFTTAADEFGLVVWPYNNNNPSSARIIVPHMVQV